MADRAARSPPIATGWSRTSRPASGRCSTTPSMPSSSSAPGGRRGKMYPVGTNVLNARTIAESARGWPTTSPGPRGRTQPRSCVIARDTRHNSPEFAEDLRPGPGGGRVQGLPLPRLSVDPPALLRRPPPEVRLRDHDHRLAQRPGGQRLQVLLGDRRPGDPARRLGDHRLRQGGLGPRDPREGYEAAIRDGSIVLVGAEVDDAYTSAVVGESVSLAATSRSSTRRCTAWARPRSPPRCSRRVSPGSTSWPRSGRPTATSPTSPATSRTPRSPRRWTLAIAEAKATGADLVIASDPDADRIGVGLPVTGDPERATGPPSTATRSAPCSPPSS